MTHLNLLVGLGNPGQEYIQTRHNAGFMLVDRLIEQAGPLAAQTSAGSASRRNSLLWKAAVAPNMPPALFLKPQTFMNLSGESVRQIASYFSIAPDNILVVHDELDLPLGRMRLKTGGGDAGHKGLLSITAQLGTPDYHRLRLGIGRPPYPDTASWVLGRFSATEQEVLDRVLAEAADCIRVFAKEGPKAAQIKANAFRAE